MSSLKILRDRRQSVQSTQKITIAMKMVAGAKLRRAQEQVEAGRPYAHYMREVLEGLATNAQALESPHPLLTGTGNSKVHLIVVASSDRGLCGPFNSSILRQARKTIEECQLEGQEVKIITIGRKAKDSLRRDYSDLIVESYTEVGQKRLRFSEAQDIADSVISMFEDKIFDVCTLIYNHFKSAMSQETTVAQVIPILVNTNQTQKPANTAPKAIYEYEPAENTILTKLLPQNVAVQIFNALLENAASEQGARMTAMDSASRNADDMIKNLNLTYNRTRQAQITRELIEIISGAEALR